MESPADVPATAQGVDDVSLPGGSDADGWSVGDLSSDAEMSPEHQPAASQADKRAAPHGPRSLQNGKEPNGNGGLRCQMSSSITSEAVSQFQANVAATKLVKQSQHYQAQFNGPERWSILHNANPQLTFACMLPSFSPDGKAFVVVTGEVDGWPQESTILNHHDRYFYLFGYVQTFHIK